MVSSAELRRETALDHNATQKYSEGGMAVELNLGAQNTYDDPWSQKISNQRKRFRRSLGALVVADAAKRDGADVTWYGARMAVAEIGEKRVLIVGPSCTESTLSAAIESDKVLTKRLLADAGVSTPQGRPVQSGEEAVAVQREIGGPVVVKPRYGAMGSGVTVNIETEEDLLAAYDRATSTSGGVLVEAYIEGSEYRGHGSANKCVGVFERLLPSVTGNGRDTVADLVTSKNKIRRLNPNTMSHLITLDAVADGFLSRQGLSRKSVVPEGQGVIVRDVNGITSGGDSRECLEEAPASVRTATSAAVAAIPGMTWGGTDIIVQNGTDVAFLMEVNTYAAISGSVFPVYGEPRDLAAEVWRRIRNHAAPEATKCDVAPEAHSEPHTVCSLVGREVATGSMEIFQNLLRQRGYRIQQQGRTTFTASNTGELLWFAGCLTEADQTRPQRAMQRQEGFRGLMDSRGVPQVSGRRVVDAGQLNEFVHGLDEMSMLIPSNGRFDDRNGRFLPPRARVSRDSLAGRKSWVVQEYPAGRRYTVIASRSQAVVVVGRRSSGLLSDGELQRIVSRAVEAVRAVPQLRWSAVQLVAPQMASRLEIRVEGMTNSPVFSRGDYLLAGSFDDFADLVLNGALQGN